MEAVHAGILPFDGERARVVDVVEGDDDPFEVDVAMARRAEVPVAARVGELGVAAEDADRAVALAPPGVFDVGVEDAVLERVEELDVVDSLIAEVRGVVVEAERGMVADGLEGALRGGDVEGDLGGMDLEGELDAAFAEAVEDGRHDLGELLEAGLDHGGRGGGPGVEQMPDRRAGEGGHDLDAEVARGLGGVHLVLDGPFGHGLVVALELGRCEGLVAFVETVAGELAGNVVGDGEAVEAVLGEEGALVLAVGFALDGLVDVEVVPPRGQLETIVAEFLHHRGELLQGQIRPLSCENRDLACHVALLFLLCWP